MTFKSILASTTLVLALTAPTAMAESFSVSLGGRTLGTLTYDSTNNGQTLVSKLDHTPLGVFDGTFTATSIKSGQVQRFDGISKSSRKSRRVQVGIKAGTAVETMVDPVSEMTPLSDPARVPADVIDPVQAIGALIHAADCPKTITIYDGRRAIALQPVEATLDGDSQTCAVAYRVVAGPGHLSPLKISKAKMKLTYVTTEGARTLARIDIGSGIFNLVLQRAD